MKQNAECGLRAYETHHLFKFIHLINQSLPGCRWNRTNKRKKHKVLPYEPSWERRGEFMEQFEHTHTHSKIYITTSQGVIIIIVVVVITNTKAGGPHSEGDIKL